MKKLLLMAALVLCATAVNAQTQCKGIKADKTRCRIMVTEGQYCRYHDPKLPTCTYIKKDGTRCRMKVNPQQLYCRYHVNGKPVK
jgi:hypothetical protein